MDVKKFGMYCLKLGLLIAVIAAITFGYGYSEVKEAVAARQSRAEAHLNDSLARGMMGHSYEIEQELNGYRMRVESGEKTKTIAIYIAIGALVPLLLGLGLVTSAGAKAEQVN